MNDLNNNNIYDGNDRHIYSERALSRGAEDLSHQGFMVYDVSSFGENRFSYGGVEFSGNYDYLIFAEFADMQRIPQGYSEDGFLPT